MKKPLTLLLLFTIPLLIHAGEEKQKTQRSAGSNIVYIDVNIDQPNVDDCYEETSLPEMRIENWLNVFPNPSPGEFNLEIYQLLTGERISITVYDITGKSVYNVDVVVSATKMTYKLNLSNLNKGVYFLQVNNQWDRSIERLIIF